MIDPDILEELEGWSDPDDDFPSSVLSEGGASTGADNRSVPTGGALVLVGTPIGNLGDLSKRAVQVLAAADVVYCEDTRHSRKLFSHAGISGVPLRSLHEHNEDARVGEILAAVGEGRTVAVVSDAGMPGISDPGSRLVAAAVQAGLVVSVVPGPSAVLAALVTSGLTTDRFVFEGFLPRSGRERRDRVAEVAEERRTTVLFEAPSRVVATLRDLAAACGGSRQVAVARELTKLHEEIWRGTLDDAVAWAEAGALRGEVVLVLDGSTRSAAPPVDDAVLLAAVVERVAAGERTRGVVDDVASAFGVPRRRVYELALAAQGAGAAGAPVPSAGAPETFDPGSSE